MKTYRTLAAIALLILSAILPAAKLHATVYYDAGTTNNYLLYTGDTLRVVSGTFRGNLNAFQEKAVVLVSYGATFKPASINTAKGTIINYGEVRFAGLLGTHDGFNLENHGIVVISGMSLYDSWTRGQKVKNFAEGLMTINGGFNMGNNTQLVNEGAVSINGNCELYSATSHLTNNGKIYVSGNTNQSAGTFINEGDLFSSEFNAWGGELKNSGAIHPQSLVISSNTTYVNNCKLVTQKGLIVEGVLENKGVIWVGGNDQPENELRIAGTFINSGGKVKAATLTNYNIMKGRGYVYISGSTYNSSAVGVSGYTTDTLRFYDATRNGANFFDTNWGTIYPNAVFRNEGIPDTTQLPPGCATAYRNAMVLPVRWNYFAVKMLQGHPLLSWSAEYEPQMKFELERSSDQVHYSVIATALSEPAAAYTYTDRTAPAREGILYYRIKATSKDGDVKYTETRMVKTAASAKNSAISIFPNPASKTSSLLYTSENRGTLTVQVKSAAGQTISIRNYTVQPGANKFELDLVQLQPGFYFVEVFNGSESLGVERLVKK
jgi:hypothetical protein